MNYNKYTNMDSIFEYSKLYANCMNARGKPFFQVNL